jgi:hypothetical protein
MVYDMLAYGIMSMGVLSGKQGKKSFPVSLLDFVAFVCIFVGFWCSLGFMVFSPSLGTESLHVLSFEKREG